jgi:NADH:ubiquinone oxidoreductase subunit 3 (subunit A)
MVPTGVFSSPFVIFAVALAIGYLMYFWSRKVAPVSPDTLNKTMPYVGGESVEAQSFQPEYHFFYVALFFTLVHIAALILATAPPYTQPWAAIGYLAIIAVSIMILRWEQ